MIIIFIKFLVLVLLLLLIVLFLLIVVLFLLFNLSLLMKILLFLLRTILRDNIEIFLLIFNDAKCLNESLRLLLIVILFLNHVLLSVINL